MNTTTEWNWVEFLERKTKGVESIEMAEELAQNWPTCAVGELCNGLPRKESGAPKDPLLFTMGADFTYFVAKQDWKQALLIFQGIEKRTAELLSNCIA